MFGGPVSTAQNCLPVSQPSVQQEGRQGLPPAIPVLFEDARSGSISEVASNGDTELRQIENSWLSIDPDQMWFRRVRSIQPADINLDGVVDGMDLLDAYHAARRLPSAGEYDLADVNQDRVVDEDDIAAIELAFGTITRPPQ